MKIFILILKNISALLMTLIIMSTIGHTQVVGGDSPIGQQSPSLVHFRTSPTGLGCLTNQLGINDLTGGFFVCTPPGLWQLVTGNGGNTPPGGSNTQIQLNNSGAFGGL